jgi:glycosyltransferase involved in cell wall biosynthesis
MSWKDPSHPEAGGAELVQSELVKRLLNDGHSVTVLTSMHEGASSHEVNGSYRVIRNGSRYTVHLQTMLYYRKNLRGWADIVIDEVNTAPFFAKYYAHDAKRYMLIHQLAREIWFFEMPPIVSHAFHLLEPLYIRALKNQPAITVSDSTKNDLVRYGHSPKHISIISEGLTSAPVESLNLIRKYDPPTLLIHGSMRAMKRTIEGIKAFEIAKESIPELALKISGSSSGAYGEKVLAYIQQSSRKDSIEYVGRTTDEQKEKLMQQCHAILVTSVREGWGLIVTEANSQGCPAVVYDVPGLRDSVRNGETGIVTHTKPTSLAAGIIDLLSDEKRYNTLQRSGYEWSKFITFEKSYKDFKKALNI